MADDYNALQIQISANASNAVRNVNRLAKALERLQTALSSVNSSNMFSLVSSMNSLNQAAQGLQGTTRAITSTARAVNNMNTNTAQSSQNLTQLANAAQNVAQNTNQAAQATQTIGANTGRTNQTVRTFGNTLRGVGSSLRNFGSRTIGNIRSLGGAFDGMRRGLSPIASTAERFAKSLFRVGKGSNSAKGSMSDLAKELTRIGKMMKLMITRMVLRKVIQGVIDGFKNLAQYSKTFDASISLLWNSFRQLGNSIAAAVSPLLNAFAPALNYLIQIVIKAVNAINQLISAMLGLGTWTRAKKMTDSYAASLDKSNKSAKELKKTVLGFDELNQLQDNKNNGGGGTSPADMFEEVPIDNKWKNWANKILDPIKKAWAKVGDEVKKAWKRAMFYVKKLAEDVARDFWEVWSQPQTVKIFEDFFKIIRDIGNIVGNLAKQFDVAWNTNKVGLRILEKIRDLIGIIVAGVQKITEAWAEWANTINFYPLLASINEFLESLKRPAQFVMDVLDDFNEHFAMPLASWFIEEAAPKLIQVFTDFNNEVDWDTIRERLDRVWKALEPFAETIGEGLIKFIDDVSDSIANFMNSKAWDDFIDLLENWTSRIDADDVATGLKVILAAILGYGAVTTVSAGITAATTFLSNLGRIGAGFVTFVGAVSEVLNAIRLFLVSPEFVTFTQFLENPASVVSISNIVDMCRGTFLDPDEWTGYIGEFVDKVGILWNDLWVVLGSPLIMINTLLEGGTMDDYAAEMDKAWQSIDKYNEAVQKLKDYNLDTSGSYDDIMYRANSLSDTMGHVSVEVEKSTNVMAGAAKGLKKDAEHSFVNVSAGAANMKTNTSKAIGDLKISVEKDTGSIQSATNKISFKPLSDAANSMKETVTIDFESVDTEVANANVFIGGEVKTISENVDGMATDIEKSTDTIKDSFTEDKWTFSGVWQGLTETFSKAKEGIKGVWNDIADSLNGNHEIFGKSVKINLPKLYAQGGFPSSGSMFIAGERGAELVGNINGRTGVANRDQITDGIAQAVFNAITSANMGGSGERYINNTIYIDDVAVARAVTKGQDKLSRRYSPTMA